MRKAAEVLLFLCLMTTCKSENSFSKRSLLLFSRFFHFIFTFWDQLGLEKLEKAIQSHSKQLKSALK